MSLKNTARKTSRGGGGKHCGLGLNCCTKRIVMGARE